MEYMEAENKSKQQTVQKSVFEEHKKEIIVIVAGAILFMTGQITDVTIIFVAAYLILGLGIVLTALKNLTKGLIFDENFLMAVATIAAFAIGDYAEAVGIMLFYKIGELFEDIAVSKSRSQIMEAVDMRPSFSLIPYWVTMARARLVAR